MPTFDIRCSTCGEEEEQILSSSDAIQPLSHCKDTQRCCLQKVFRQAPLAHVKGKWFNEKFLYDSETVYDERRYK